MTFDAENLYFTPSEIDQGSHVVVLRVSKTQYSNFFSETSFTFTVLDAVQA